MNAVIFIMAMLVLASVFAFSEIFRLRGRVDRMQRQIDGLCSLTGHEESSSGYLEDEVRKTVMNLKAEGREVEAVKLIREYTGCNLVEAKSRLDAMG